MAEKEQVTHDYDVACPYCVESYKEQVERENAVELKKQEELLLSLALKKQELMVFM